MNTQELQIYGPVNGVNGLQKITSSSPVPSGVSLRSNKSMQMPIQLKKSLMEKGFQLERCSSYSPSEVSMKSDKSMQMSIQFNRKPVVPEKSSQIIRSSSPVPSGVSMKSDKSMQMPIQLNERPPIPEKSFQVKRSSSSPPSWVSLKSDKSMQMPIQFNGKPVASGKRSSSPVPSGVSMRSDKSMQNPIQLKERPSIPEKSFQLKRSSSSPPSGLSLKSDKSMQMPIQFIGKPVVSGKRLQLKRSISSVPSVESLTDAEPLPTEERLESGSLGLPSEKLKNILGERCHSLFEGTATQGNPVPLNEVFTEVFITENMNEDLHNDHEVSQIEAIYKIGTKDFQIKCNNIFKPLHGKYQAIRTVLTKGVAGIGKTVSVQKFILDFAEGKANQDIHFLFPLPFREMNLMRDQKHSLNDLLQHFFMKGIDASSPQIASHSLVFILDGLDECRLPLDFQNNESLSDPTKETSVDILLTNLIKGNLLPSAKIWITSRPAAAGLIPTDCIDRITEVRGFDEPQKEEYFRKRISDQSLASGIITHLKSLKSLYIMCHIPVFCWMAATVLERMVVDSGLDKIPKTLTQMYTHFLTTQIHRKKAKYSESKVTGEEMILKLGKLAFEQLENGNLIFYEEDLRECGIDVKEASVYSGVFTQIFREEFGLFQRKVFSFVHLSIQEHLAALYVFLCFNNYNQNVLNPQKTSASKEPVTMSSLLKTAVDKASMNESGHLDLFLRFLMGFALESNQILLQNLLVQRRDLLVHRRANSVDIRDTTDYLKIKIRESVCPHFSIKYFHCLNELNDTSLVDEIQTFLKSRIHIEDLSIELMSAFLFILLTSDEKLDVFKLSNYGQSDKALICLMPVIRMSQEVRLDNCMITVRGCAVLVIFLFMMTVMKELDLSHNNLQDAGVKMLCTGIQADVLEKKKKDCSVAEKCDFLASILDLNSSKKEEALVWDYTSEKIYHFLEVFHHKFTGLQGTKCNIRSLRLNNCGVTRVGCGFLALVLNSNSSNLQELELSQNSIGDSGVKVLSDALKKASCKLDTLKLDDCKITEHGCAELASALQAKSPLKTISLCNNSLQDSGVKLLAAGLKNLCCKIETLGISNCDLKLEGFASLASAFRANPSHLRVIDLSRNKPGDLGVKLLSAALKETHCESIKLKECGITRNSCETLASALSSETSYLRELELSGNHFRDSGAELLFVGLRSPHCKLQKLVLKDCGITENSCATLASALSSETSCLRELDLSGNNLKQSGAELLSTGLENSHCKLQRLALYNCHVEEDGFAALKEVLHSKCHLITEKPGDSRLQLLSDTG